MYPNDKHAQEKVSVTSTGIGGPSASIAMEELVQCGANTFIRVGTCGGIDLDMKGGDLIVATGAVRMEGTSREYAPIEYPAAHLRVRCGSTFLVAGNQERNALGMENPIVHDTEAAITVGVEAIRRLIRQDRESKAQ